MAENSSSGVAQFVLPFSIASENRKEPFGKEMEHAALFCLAELERNKGGGLILKQPAERMAFITEVGYPFWLIPWKESTLMFDGLNRIAYTLAYQIVPDVHAFTSNLERSSRTPEVYMAFLSDNINYFQVTNEEKKMIVGGLITEKDLLNEFASNLPEATQTNNPLIDVMILTPILNASNISSTIHELEALDSGFREDINNLYSSMKLVDKITNSLVKTVRARIKVIKEKFGEEIKKIEATTLPRVDRIREEYDDQIVQLLKDFQKKSLPLQQEKIKLEKTKDQILNRIEHAKTEAKMAAVKKDAVSERKWKEKTGDYKKEVSEGNSKIKETQQKLKEMEDNKSLETFKLRSEAETKTREAKKDLLETEAKRDAEIQMHTQEIEKLHESTSTIISQIDKTAKLREAKLAELENLGIQQKRKNYAIIQVPFYLISYQSDQKRRYVVISPPSVNSIGISTKIKGVLGQAKIKQMLTPRLKALDSFLARLPSFIGQNAVFEREINENAAATKISETSANEQLSHGLQQLKSEGWFTEKEYEAFSQKLK